MIRTSIHIGGTRLSDHDFTSVNIIQAVGQHHTFEVRLRQDANRGVLMTKAKSWIGQPIKIGLDNKEDDNIIISPVKDVFKGIITSIGLSRQSGTGELVVRGESPSIVLDDGPNTRSFTDKNLQEIVDEVLRPYMKAFPESPEVDPNTYKKSKPFCVQYKESNFNFLTRLANRYGEWFYYDGLNLYFGKRADGAAINLDFGEDSLSYFDLSLKAIPAKFEMKGYDYLTHKQLSENAPSKVANNDLGKQVINLSTSKIFTQAPSVSIQTALEEGEFKNLIERREQINLDETVLFNGSSRNVSLKLGAKITVKDNLIGEDYGSFILTNIVHYIGQGGDYNNSFEAIPVEVKIPPLNAMPNPPFCETQLAKVTDVDDEKGLGRVRVKFLWQEGSKEKSPWIRVASPYTGKDKGFYIIPEVEDQVLVAFENNNPDKPYVLTGMYNGDAKPEWFDPKNHYKGFKSKGKNEWKFDDKKEAILIHAPKEMTLSAGKTITIKTGGKGDSVINIDVGDGTVNVSAKTVNVDAKQTIKMESGKEVKIEGTQSVSTKSMAVKTEGSAKVEVKGTLVEVKGTPIKLN